MSFEENKRALLERKRNLLFLIAQYINDLGLVRTHSTLRDEANLKENYEICDNVDLDTIYLDFCSYYQLKFGKQPKIVKRTESKNVTVQLSNANKSMKVKRRMCENETNKDTSTAADNMLLNSSITVSSLTHSNNSNSSLHSNSNDYVNSMSNELPPVDYKFPFRDYEHYNSDMKEMADIISRDIVKKDPQIKWHMIQGNDEAKEILNESVILPLQYPKLFSGVVKPWRGILIHGPPGTGKTMLAKALNSETFGKVTFFNVIPSTIISKWRGDSEKFLRILFHMAKFYEPSVIFIDEFESLASNRSASGEHEASKRFKNEFLMQIDELDSGETNVLLLASTNLPWNIDPAFLRRLEQKVLIGLPNEETRINIVKHILPISRKWNHEQHLELSDIASGLTGADLKIACKEASIMQIRKALKNQPRDSLKVNEVTFEDLKYSLQRIQPTMEDTAERHKAWNKKHGNSDLTLN